jgi:signal recognition particle subunit SRP54
MIDFLTEKFSSIFSRLIGQHKLTERNIDEAVAKIHDALLEADVPQAVVQEFIDKVKTAALGQKVLNSLKPGEQFIKVVYDQLLQLVGQQSPTADVMSQFSLVMVLGLQGSGKTTTLGKLAQWIKDQTKKSGKSKKVLLASVDFYRPAAIDQLEILAKQVGATFYRSPLTEPVAAAQDIQQFGRKNGFDIVLLDTAGRLHIDSTMLEELREIDARVSPTYKLLVLDAMTGQESLAVAKAFDQGVGFTGAVLSKMDSDTRGGAALSFRYSLQKPILFVGSGEKVTDLELFHAERLVKRMLGMGDLESLLERAEQKIAHDEQQDLMKSMMSGRMTLQDFARQMEMMGRIGSLTKLAQYMPGIGGVKITPEMMEQGDKELKKFKAIISSMTLKERVQPKILDSSRKQRIAKGAGAVVADINRLLERFEQTQQYAKLFKKFGRF